MYPITLMQMMRLVMMGSDPAQGDKGVTCVADLRQSMLVMRVIDNTFQYLLFYKKYK